MVSDVYRVIDGTFAARKRILFEEKLRDSKTRAEMELKKNQERVTVDVISP
jgi:hypothetical protein